MTGTNFLDCFKAFTEDVVKDSLLPVKPSKKETEPENRRPAVHNMRLPDMKSTAEKAPYIINQIITTERSQEQTQRQKATATVRSIFCVYCPDEEEGGMMLLELMDRLEIALIKAGVIGKFYVLNLEEKVEKMIYPDDTAPFYMGEMKTVWNFPPVEREVDYGKYPQGHYVRDIGAGP